MTTNSTRDVVAAAVFSNWLGAHDAREIADAVLSARVRHLCSDCHGSGFTGPEDLTCLHWPAPTVGKLAAIGAAVMEHAPQYPEWANREAGEWSGTVETFNMVRQTWADSFINHGHNALLATLREVEP